MRAPHSRLAVAFVVAAGLGAGALAAGALLPPRAPAAAHFADADDMTLVASGKQLYRQHCAGCHGRYLQGQPLWQLLDKDAGRRAPAQDETGHSWQHADEDLFHVIKYGRFPPVASDEPSAMPAFEARLGDRDILAVLAFIKARWPLGIRVSQALLNPDDAGMPAGADAVEWRLPPTCNVLLQRQRARARSGG
jgi:mono/diheme cytochrome c family protein